MMPLKLPHMVPPSCPANCGKNAAFAAAPVRHLPRAPQAKAGKCLKAKRALRQMPRHFARILPRHAAAFRGKCLMLCLILASVFGAAACSNFRPAMVEDHREWSSVRVPFIPPQHYAEREISSADTVHIDLGFMDFRMLPIPVDGAPRWRIEARTKSDTLWANVPSQSRTITRTEVQKEMPWWGFVVITALGLALLLAVIRR